MTPEQSPQSVTLGCWVKVAEKGVNEEEVFHIVEPNAANVLENKLPPESPLAQALLGAEAGDNVRLEAPKGPVELTILDLGRD